MERIDALVGFLKTCPHLKHYGKEPYVLMSVDTMGTRTGQYSIEAEPANEWVKRYIDGSGTKQFVFAFISTRPYSEKSNAETMAFYENFSEWARSAEMPSPDWIALETLTGGYLMDVNNGANSARYQIQCRLLYHAAAKG